MGSGATRPGVAKRTVVCLLTAAVGATAHAQSVDSAIKPYRADFSISESPAATALGIDLDRVVVPRSTRDFAASVIGLTDGNGKGGAIEFAPAWLFVPNKIFLGDYAKEGGGSSAFWLRAGVNTTIGLATAKSGDTDNKVTSYAYSLDTVFLDAADPVLSPSLRGCIGKAQKTLLDNADLTPQPPGSGVEEISSPQFEQDVKKCYASFKAQSWNRSRVAAGLWSGQTKPETTQQRRSLGTTVWATAAYGFDNFKPLPAEEAKQPKPGGLARSAQVLLHLRHTRNEPVENGAGGFSGNTANRTLIGARFVFGEVDRSLFAEASRSRRKESLGPRTDETATVVGFSYKLTKDMWLNVASGRKKTFSSATGEYTAMASLKFGAESEPLFAVPR